MVEEVNVATFLSFVDQSECVNYYVCVEFYLLFILISQSNYV